MSFDELLRSTKERVEKKKKDYPFEWLGRSLAYNNYPPRDAKRVLKSKESFSLISELDVDASEELESILKLAQEYEKAKVNVLSVATDELFGQDLELITALRRYTKTPLMHNELIIDEYQLLESVVYGADMVGLEPKALSKKELKELLEFARRLGMEAILMLRDKEDLTKAILAGADVLCIEHQDLVSDRLDMSLNQKLLPLIPNGKIILSKSGISEKSMMHQLYNEGIDGFFLSGFFSDKPEKAEAVRELRI